MQNLEFTMTVSPSCVTRLGLASNRIILDAEGVDFLKEELAGLGVEPKDILNCVPNNNSIKDEAVRQLVLQLEDRVQDIIFAARNGWFLYASVLAGEIVEYQVSNGVVGERSDSFDTYWYSEAFKIFKEHACI